VNAFPALAARLAAGEARTVFARLRRNAIGTAAMAGLGLVAAVFLLVAAYLALARSLGPAEAALVLGAAFAALTTAVWIALRILAARDRRRRREQARSRAALAAAAAATLLPGLLSSRLALAALPVAAICYLLLSGNEAGDEDGGEVPVPRKRKKP
jgi:hypothetical protein